MSKRNAKPSAFCTHEEVFPFLPPEIQKLSVAEILAMSRAGNWPPYIKIISQRNPAWFRKSDLLAWAKLKWGTVHPRLVQEMAGAFESRAPSEINAKAFHRRNRNG